MVAPLLVADPTVSNTITVSTMVGATLTQLGDSITGLAQDLPDASSNLVVHAFGGVYCYTLEGVYKLQGGLIGTIEGSWSRNQVDGGATFPAATGGPDNVGLWYIVIDNEPYVFGTYPVVGGTRVFRLNIRTSVLETGSTIAVSPNIQGYSALWNGNVYLVSGTNAARIVDPNGLTISAISATGDGWITDYLSSRGADLDVFNGQLYALMDHNVDGQSSVYEFSGGDFNRVLSLDSVNTAGGARPLLFNDGTSMYAIFHTTTDGTGWKAFQINSTGGSLVLGSELTNTVLPAGLRSGSGSLAVGRWWATQNQLSTGSPEILIHFASNSTGASWEQYLWNGPNSLMTLQDTGGDSRLIVPADKRGGGDRIFDEDAPTVTIYSRERVAGGERVTYRCTGGQMDQIVRFYFGTEGEVPTTQAQLVGTATGGNSLRNGNQVEMVDCDGVTDYTIIIQATGFNNLDRIELVARISNS